MRAPTALVSAFCLLVLLAAAPANAAMLGSVYHDYGKNLFDPGGNDELKGNHVRVSTESSSRFADTFDFSSISYTVIDYFELCLTYSKTSSGYFLFFPKENWFARPGGTLDYSPDFSLGQVGGSAVTTSFTIDSSLPEFGDILADQSMDLWFANDASHPDWFKLFDAELKVYGSDIITQPIPVPAAMWVMVSGLAGLLCVRTRLR